jgi:small neutral amino acid transporter SnatA (MarC family)
MPRQTSDLVALILAVVVAFVIIATTIVLLWLALTGQRSAMGTAADAISRFVSVIIAALVGYMAGRQVNTKE